MRRRGARKADMQGIEREGSEEAFRRGYEHAAIETFYAVSRFLIPAAREILRTWVQDDVYVWRHNSMRGYRLINDVPRSGFRLEEATAEDRTKVR